MALDSTEDAITYFLTDVAPVSESGVGDPVNRGRALRFLQTKVAQYWEPPWKLKEKQAEVAFDAGTGIAGLPDDFSTWDRNYGLLVWGSPINTEINPTKCRALNVMALRTKYPTRTGHPIAVAMYGGALARWPTLPPGGVAEAATAFYHRTRPELIDFYGLPDPEEEDPQDEWPLIPVDDQEVLIEGLLAIWQRGSGDNRDANQETYFRKRCRELYKSRNQDQQPGRIAEPFRASRASGPRIGYRYQT